ncbi:RICIN domain-containing protein [Paractinoplanes brasiliensis]|uniref:Ricin-type beta-trefoil lectin protein n=1 Tax=Paractinoplanes brasiliensis TaxID=52695 RepID=A0A4R6JCS4_9ACTN|nr:RICIN domain-containing protein [Actinoplanes brasiliensis]TDO32345.1 ricin-type beta-trefoil lectin protein [Actinoplanes brasiliensis]
MRRSPAFLTALITATLPTLLTTLTPAQASPPLQERANPQSSSATENAPGGALVREQPGGGAARDVPGGGLVREEPGRDGVRDKPGNAVSGRAGNPIDLIGLDFQLINAASRWCLTSGLTELPCATTDPYRWRFRPVNVVGGFEILNVRTSTCLSMPGGVTTDGARAGLAPCAAVPSRRWELRDSLGDTAKVVNTRTGKCLQIEGGVAVQGSCAGTHGIRRWTVRVVGLPFFSAGKR